MLWVFPNPLKMFTVVAYNFEDADEARWLLENCYDIKTEDDFMFERPTFNCERFDVDTLDSRFHFAPPPIPIMPK